MSSNTAPIPAVRSHTVTSVDRAIKIIEFVADSGESGLNLTQVAKLVGTSKSTAYNLVWTLVDRGLLRATDPGPRYQLGYGLVRLGDLAGNRLLIGELSTPILRELSSETGLTGRAAVSDSGYPIFVSRVDGPGSVRFHTPLGGREMPHTSSAGKAIMSTLPTSRVVEICGETQLPRRTRKTITTIEGLLDDLRVSRARGYAVDDEEDVEGVFCVGSAFFDHSGSCAGAISATGIKRDLPAWEVEQLGRIILSYADKVSESLEGPTFAAALEGRTFEG